MAFEDYEAFEEPLTLTIRGHKYTLPPVGMQDGAKLAIGKELSNEEFRRIILGDVYEQMVTDNIPAVAVTRVMATALAEFQGGRPAAELVWKTGGDPKAMEAATREAEAATTPRRASTSGTRKKPASRSVKSSNTGA